MPNNFVEMGWGAAPMKEQHPVLSDADADHFDKDNQAISRLLLRGLITRQQAHTARVRYAKKVGEAVIAALEAGAHRGNGDVAGD
jgi:hypothetical protein